jgi:hypothetical protein
MSFLEQRQILIVFDFLIQCHTLFIGSIDELDRHNFVLAQQPTLLDNDVRHLIRSRIEHEAADLADLLPIPSIDTGSFFKFHF